MMIYFHQNKLFHMYFSNIMQIFKTYFLLEATLNDCICDFFYN